MAVKASIATGNWLTAGTWGVVDATSYLNSETGVQVITTAYSGTVSSGFTPGAITIDAIYFKLNVRTGVTGTISVHLAIATVEVPGTLVTINTADLPAAVAADLNGGWICFKLTAPVLLVGATVYTTEVKTSSASMVSLWRDGTAGNVSRALRTTTTGAPTTGDDMIVAGEKTGAGTSNAFVVTMDALASAITDYGAASTSLVLPAIAICDGGTLTFGTTAATAYYLKVSGNVIVYAGGTFNMATVASPMPSDSSGVLEFDCAVNVDFGLTVRNLGVFVGQGNPITTVRTLLNTDEAAAATVIGVVSTAGWSVGDVLCFAPTTQTSSQAEHKTILTVDSAVQVTLTAGLTNAHSGTSPTQGAVGNITRNVKIRGISVTLQGYVDIKAVSTVDCDYVEFYQLGSATSLKRGIDLSTTTGSTSFVGCSFHDFTVASSVCINLPVAQWNNITISNSVFYLSVNSILDSFNTLVTNYTFSDLLFIRCGAATLVDVGGTITNWTAAGGTGGGISIQESNGVIGTISGLTAHSNATTGITLQGIGTVSTLVSWRNANWGSALSGANDLLLDGVTLFGNSSRSILISGTGKVVINNLVSNGDTTFATAAGVDFNGAAVILDILNGDFSTVAGIKTAHTADFNFVAATYTEVNLHNTKLGAATEVDDQATSMLPTAYITSQKHDQTAGLHKTWKRYGTITIDTTIFDTTPSVRMTPNNTSGKLETTSLIKVAVANGTTATVSVKVRESVAGDGTDYNGSRVQLCVRRNVAAGIAADTVLATATVASEGAWETLNGTTIAVTDDCYLEFYVCCDGTTGWINVDTVTLPTPRDTKGLAYWENGRAMALGDNAAAGAASDGGAVVFL